MFVRINMKRAIVTTYLLLIIGNFLSFSQIIKGKVVMKLLDSYEPLPGVTIHTDTTYYITDFNGLFCFNSFKKNLDFILFKASYFANIKIINLPSNFDTLDLGTIEMIEHKVISKKQYDSIRNAIIKSFKPDIISVQISKADKILQKKYKPVYHWAELLGYIVIDEVSSGDLVNPFDNYKRIVFEYDSMQDLILMDYKKIIE